MTLIGKILVMLNVAVSLGLMAFGAALFSTRVDWTDSAAKGTVPAGVTYEKKAQLAEALKAIGPAEATWADSYASLFVKEKARHEDRVFFNSALAAVRGDGPAGGPPPRAAVLDKGLPREVDGKLVMEDARTFDGQPLASIKASEALLGGHQKENARVLALLEAEIKKDIARTDELVGVDGNKGLRIRIQDEIVKREGIEEEIDLTRPMFEGTRVTAGLYGRRIAMLDEQIAELKRAVERLKKLDGAEASR